MHVGNRDVRGGEVPFENSVFPSRVTRVLVKTQMFEWSTLSSVEGKGSSVSRVGCLKCDGAAMQARTLASNRQAKAIKASHGTRVSPQSKAKERV